MERVQAGGLRWGEAGFLTFFSYHTFIIFKYKKYLRKLATPYVSLTPTRRQHPAANRPVRVLHLAFRRDLPQKNRH